MEYAADICEKIESRFLLLPPEEKTSVISHGVAIRFSELNRRLFLALSKIRFFEEKYRIKLSELEENWLTSDNRLKIGWDNAPHHRQLEGFPYHKYVEDQNNLQLSAERLSLEEVLQRFNLTLPSIHNVFRWWRKDVLKELLLIRSVVWNVEKDEYKRLCWLALCSSALDCANIHRNHPTISFDDDNKRDIDVWGDFKENIEIILKDLQQLPKRERWGDVRIMSGDSTRLADIIGEPIQRVITSPPYPNRFSYVHTTRPQLFFMEVFSGASQSAELDCAAIGGTWGKATSILYNDIIEPYPHINNILSPTVEQLRPRNNLMCNYAVKYFNMMDEHIRVQHYLASAIHKLRL